MGGEILHTPTCFLATALKLAGQSKAAIFDFCNGAWSWISIHLQHNSIDNGIKDQVVA